MLTLPPSVRIYLAVDKVDMRCGHDGLGAIVRNQWKLDLYQGHLFVFNTRPRCRRPPESNRVSSLGVALRAMPT